MKRAPKTGLWSRYGKSFFDVGLAGVALLLLSPILLAGVIAVAAGDGFPVFYRARRFGKRGELFTMYKLRTMRRSKYPPVSRITSYADSRVFPMGRLLRRWKVDELPQLVNILRGEMSFVGPRPEDPEIVRTAYTEQDRGLLLSVKPGLVSPGTLYNYTHGETLLNGKDAERIYVEKVLRLRLALDAVYLERQGLRYDVQLIFRTLSTIFRVVCGKIHFDHVPELSKIRSTVADGPPSGW